ncbi:MAG: hypothetical protein HC846_00385 [Blastocatellia bacterium]|nr:hypothetical protein [Blastocatellia bacterium]
MFETDLDESISGSYIRRFSERFFPVLIIKKPDYLIIEDKRIDGKIVLPFFFFLLILPLLIMISPLMIYSIFGFVLVVLFLLLAIFLFYIILSTSFRQRAIFNKDKDFYEIIKTNFLKSESISGKISDLKAIKIEVNWYETDDRERRHTSTSYLIPKDIILNDLRRQTLERNTFNNDYKTTTKIVFAVCDYLNIPYFEEEFERG